MFQLSAMTKPGIRGKYNSSATRVRPFFEACLIQPKESNWLGKLLSLANETECIPRPLLDDPGPIEEVIFETETMQEQRIGPPRRFLEWLLQHPDRMTWPKGDAGRFSARTQENREALFGRRGAQEQGATIERALHELKVCGPQESSKKWWAFEGRTCVDCYVRTSKLRLYVEGKRTEPLSSSTAWFPQRNQFVRNLEAAREDAEGGFFGCLLMSEAEINIPAESIESGLPHLDSNERRDLLQHYIGTVTWRQACSVTAISYADLPDVCSAH